MTRPLPAEHLVATTSASRSSASDLKTGIGLRALHHQVIFAQQPGVGFLEIHAENYMTDRTRRTALAARAIWPISVHGVGLSLGGAEPLDPMHLDRLARLVAELDPILVSEHVAWCRQGGVYFNDLLPLPYTEEALDILVDHVDQVQERLGRQILMENPSTYLQFVQSSLSEGDFLAELVRRSGCGLLLDINNLYVNQRNHSIDPRQTLAALDPGSVQEMHLAGHRVVREGGTTILIDDHGSQVDAAVWQLYEISLQRFSAPTLIEWDSQIPDLDVLVAEANLADGRRDKTRAAMRTGSSR